MHIGLLVTGHVPDNMLAEFGEYGAIFPRLLAGHGFTFSTYFVVDNEFPDSIHAAEGWLITGSRHGAYEDHPWIAPLEDFIREAYGARVPMVGICFGHQIIAQALGGRVEKFTDGWAVGRQVYDYDGLGEVAVNAWHQDQVVTRPEDARVIARNEFCENAALIYGDRALTIQPHPEFDKGFLTGLIQGRGRGVVPDAQLDAALAQVEQPIGSQLLADQIAAFFKQPRTSHV